MAKKRRNYIIYTWPWNENSGGVIFMHNLCHQLNLMGEQAYLRRATSVYKLGPRSWIKYMLKRGAMKTNPALNTPLARSKDLNSESIVVYAEITLGNPLGLKNVVRWLLYKPGLAHPFKFGENEMFFKAGEMCDIEEITGGAPDLYLWQINPAYRNENRPDRKGVCYIVRKGSKKPRIAETESPEAICVDQMSHEEMNEIFNRCDTFYSYDEATMYSQFAAICGCTSIVVPGLFSSRSEWVANHPNGRYGIAYGNSDSELEHARATRHLLIDDMQKRETSSLDTVKNFIDITKEKFWAD